VTIAIGATFQGGAIICSDTKISASDGATFYGSKQFLGVSATKKMYALASASEDAYAARMLGAEISDAISKTDKSTRVEPGIKSVMGTWFNDFQQIRPPSVQFLLALIQEGWENASLYYCEPPNTVAYGSPIAIGKGSRPVEPLLDILSPVPHEQMDARSALLRVAYLMYLAKRDEGSACGGDTYATAISADGGFTLVSDEEMERAESLAMKLDKSIESGIRRITGSQQSTLHRSPYPESLDSVTKEFSQFEFQSLKYLQRKLWKRERKSGK
jgi:20S proteasome alpha/beta subunit